MLVLRSAVTAINEKGGHECAKGKKNYLGGCGERKEEGEVMYFYYNSNTRK